MHETLGSIFSSLDISATSGLAFDENADMTVYQRQFFKQAKEKLGIDAVYFLRDSEGAAKTPLIYFSAMNEYDAEKVADLHRLSWNMGDAPLLFVVLPDELRIYNNYVSPQKKDGQLDPDKGLIEAISLIVELETQRKLQKYSRIQLESGEYWRKNSERFDIKNRVDTTLMNNLKYMRRTLLSRIQKRIASNKNEGINPAAIVHSLLGRSILIKYLEERTDSKGNAVFPIGFFSSFYLEANEYADVLQSKESTYSLFRSLEQRFHGDMFPLIEQEEEVIIKEDLTQLAFFLNGNITFSDSQMALWQLYSFNVIPIQLISSIYELFFHLSDTDDDDKGTYYTPYHLVEMLMDEVLPWEEVFREIKILDPACGSGIFLVEAYRRIVGKWIYSNKLSKISSNELGLLMQRCIYGVDSNEEAIRIASFSLSLTMCDFLEPRCIWEELEFPRMKHYNLFISDFFATNTEFEKVKYDIVIGNPPWQSQLTPLAAEYVEERNFIVGDDQVAQAFSWKAGEVCHGDGVICLLMPSKGFLFNRSKTNLAYRNTFFKEYNVSVIINYSAYRKVLFEHATGPAAGIVYQPQKSSANSPIFYCTPKPTYTVEDRRRFFIEPIDICRIPRDLVNDDRIWKIAMWGGPRDLDLINKLNAMNPTLDTFIVDNNMKKAEGFKRGNRKKSCPEFLEFPMVYAKDMKPFNINQEDLEYLEDDGFECTIEKNRIIIKAPHLLIKQSPKKWRFWAAYLDYDAVFNHSILGVSGDEALLKYLCIIIQSKVFSYFQLMTNRRWLVERDEIEMGDFMSMPISTPNEAELAEACRLYDRICGAPEKYFSEIDDFVYSQYALVPYEINLVEDAIDYVFDLFDSKKKSKALTAPPDIIFHNYSEVIHTVLKNTLDRSAEITCHIHKGNAPLIVARISFGANNSFDTITDHNVQTDDLLKKLDDLLIDERSESVYVKRNVRIYNKDEVFIIKPNQQKYWTYSAACRDADEIFADVMRAWRGLHE